MLLINKLINASKFFVLFPVYDKQVKHKTQIRKKVIKVKPKHGGYIDVLR